MHKEFRYMYIPGSETGMRKCKQVSFRGHHAKTSTEPYFMTEKYSSFLQAIGKANEDLFYYKVNHVCINCRAQKCWWEVGSGKWLLPSTTTLII